MYGSIWAVVSPRSRSLFLGGGGKGSDTSFLSAGRRELTKIKYLRDGETSEGGNLAGKLSRQYRMCSVVWNQLLDLCGL